MSTPLSAFSLEAHAKLNLRLEVGPLSGSLHQIRSVVAELDLADALHFAPSPSGFQVVCEGAQVAEHDNLAWRAARALTRDLPDVRIVIEKRIPLQAGLGGGSADAAASLLGLARILRDRDSPVPHDRIARAALTTGSDVPSFLVSGLRTVAGVGDVVKQHSGAAPSWGIALLRPRVGSSTANAYALLDQACVPHDLGPDVEAKADEMCRAFVDGDFGRFVGLLHNDFTGVIERALPAIAAARERLERAGAQATILCGSGSCVAGFFQSRAAAREALARVPLLEGEWTALTGFKSG